MIQYDSYLIYGCHFPNKSIELITSHSSLKYFNNKIRQQYNCEILELEIPLYDNNIKKEYYLSINLNRAENSLIKFDKIEKISLKGYVELLKMFNLSELDPYLISVPFVRNLPE